MEGLQIVLAFCVTVVYVLAASLTLHCVILCR